MNKETLCVIKTTLRNNNDQTISIKIHNMILNLNESVEDQIYDMLDNTSITTNFSIIDFKWSENLNIFNS